MSDNDRFVHKLSAFLRASLSGAYSTNDPVESQGQRESHTGEAFNLSLPKISDGGEQVAAALERLFATSTRPDSLEVRHPFSGARLHEERQATESEPFPPSAEAVETVVERAIATLDIPPLDEGAVRGRRTLFYLWRNLRPALKSASPDAWAPTWDVVPATPRMPDHGTFQHRQVDAAFSSIHSNNEGVKTDAALVLFTVGPVQRFIQQSRKTKDLYWSSYLLAHLCWTGLKRVVWTQGPDAVVFPDLFGQPFVDHWLECEKEIEVRESQSHLRSVPTLPNRFFAVVECDSAEDLRELMGQVQNDVKEEWRRLGERVLGSSLFAGVDAPDPFEAHLDDALATYWAGVPIQPNGAPVTSEGLVERVAPHMEEPVIDRAKDLLQAGPDGETGETHRAGVGRLYDVLYTLVEKRLASQKNIRTFHPLNSETAEAGERGRKCSLCGERNVLFYRGDPAQIEHNGAVRSLDAEVDPVLLSDGEGLCGACFVKRFGGQALSVGPDRGFDSTAEVASSTMRHQYGSAVEQCANKMRGVVGGGRFEAQLLYKENLTADYLDAYVYPDGSQGQDALQEKAAELQRIYEDTLEGAPASAQSAYYGIIALDGDGMGEWLAGERAPDLEEVLHSGVRDGLSENGRQVLKNVGQRPLTPALHATLSQSLAGYALHAARPIVEAHQGFLVYAGGDDVLAFVSIENALPLLLDLRAAFSGHRSSNGSIDLAASPTGFVHEENRIRTTLGPSATASAGLAVAHYKTPLGLVLDTAYRMEEQAKDAPGKDAWAAAVMKRSGERTKTRLPFRPAGLDHPEGSIGVLSGVVQDLKERDISPVFARQLRRELAPLVGQDGTFGEGMTEGSEILKGELTRLLKRRDVDSDWAEKTAHMLERLYVSTGSNVDNFLSALSTALFLIKET